MVYVARTLFMPSGQELFSKVVTVSAGKVVSVGEFVAEYPSMVFVNEMHIFASGALSSLNEIDKEAHHADGPLYAYSADALGRLELLG